MLLLSPGEMNDEVVEVAEAALRSRKYGYMRYVAELLCVEQAVLMWSVMCHVPRLETGGLCTATDLKKAENRPPPKRLTLQIRMFCSPLALQTLFTTGATPDFRILALLHPMGAHNLHCSAVASCTQKYRNQFWKCFRQTLAVAHGKGGSGLGSHQCCQSSSQALCYKDATCSLHA